MRNSCIYLLNSVYHANQIAGNQSRDRHHGSRLHFNHAHSHAKSRIIGGTKSRNGYITLSLMNIYTTIGDACVCVCVCVCKIGPISACTLSFRHQTSRKFFSHVATFPSPTFGPLFAFHCPLFFTKNNNLQCRDVLKSNGDYPR